MLNLKTGERELAYVVKVDDVLDMEGANNQIAVVGGWTIFVKRGQFKPGDLAIYIEIDSKVPPTEQFEFLSKYDYKVKTQRFVKGKVISQGLLMSPDQFGWTYIRGTEELVSTITDGKGGTLKEGDFLTDLLNITYYEPEDNSRKASEAEIIKEKKANEYDKWVKKHPLLSKIGFIVRLKKKAINKKYKKNKSKLVWPSWVVKTDEERVQNLTRYFRENSEERKHTYTATEKLDGASSTFTAKRIGKKKFEYYICSRNMVYNENASDNMWIEMSKKYDMKNVCISILKRFTDLSYVTIQGETYGTVQKRKYGNDNRMAIFNLIFGFNDGVVERFDPVKMAIFIKSEYPNLECVPIVAKNIELPATCEDILKMAGGPSAIDGGMREGLVFRSEDGRISFKAVDNKYLEKFH